MHPPLQKEGKDVPQKVAASSSSSSSSPMRSVCVHVVGLRGRGVAIQPELAAYTAFRQLAGDVTAGRVSQPSVFPLPLHTTLHTVRNCTCCAPSFFNCCACAAHWVPALTLTCSKVNTVAAPTWLHVLPPLVMRHSRTVFRQFRFRCCCVRAFAGSSTPWTPRVLVSWCERVLHNQTSVRYSPLFSACLLLMYFPYTIAFLFSTLTRYLSDFLFFFVVVERLSRHAKTQLQIRRNRPRARYWKIWASETYRLIPRILTGTHRLKVQHWQ